MIRRKRKTGSGKSKGGNMRIASLVLIAVMALGLAGCETISKPYIMTVDRTDQKVEGNRGYLSGTPPQPTERHLKRELIAVDMDLVEIQGKPTQPTTIVTNMKQGAPAAQATPASAKEEQIK